jgi:hypothetical protein
MYFSTRNVGKLISRSTSGLARYQFSTAARSKIQSLRKILQHNIPYIFLLDLLFVLLCWGFNHLLYNVKAYDKYCDLKSKSEIRMYIETPPWFILIRNPVNHHMHHIRPPGLKKIDQSIINKWMWNK